jgi:hypothetical protein
MTDAVRYLCIVRLDETDRVLVWEGEDPGPARVVVDDNGFIVVFASEVQARQAAASWSISPDEGSLYDNARRTMTQRTACFVERP